MRSGQVHTSYGETILPTNSANGGRSRCGYDDGCGGGAPARTARGTGAYRASSASNAGTVGLRGHYVASVVTEGRRGRAGAGNGVGGAPELRWWLRVSEGGHKSEMHARGRSRRLRGAMQGVAARRGWAGQSNGDARPPSAPRGGQALARSATDERRVQFVSRPSSA